MILWDDMWNDRFAQDEAMELAHRLMFFRIAALESQSTRERIHVENARRRGKFRRLQISNLRIWWALHKETILLPRSRVHRFNIDHQTKESICALDLTCPPGSVGERALFNIWYALETTKCRFLAMEAPF